MQDWAEQASQMAKIFSNAYLTIAASASENGSQGLLNRLRTTRILDAIHNDKAFAVYVRDNITHIFRDDGTGVPFGQYHDLPLRYRAWCFQEEVLSTRIAHFTEHEVVFVCRAATICECNSLWQTRFLIPPIVGTTSAKPFRIWESIVEDYSERQISFCKDRLPALSSSTHYFQAGSDRYHAGLWESHMPGSLLWWSSCGKRPEQEQRSQSRPPSWSWASIEGVVRYPQLNEPPRTIVQILDICTYPSTVDPRGMVTGGQITLRGSLFPLEGTWKEHESPWQSFLLYHNHAIDFDCCFACSPGWAPNLRWLEQDHCYCVLDDLNNPLMLLPNRVIDAPIFLLVIHCMDDSNPIEGVPYPGACGFLGLLLKPFEDLDEIQTKTMEDSKSKLSFMRIGFGGMCLSKKEGEEALNRFKDTVVTIF